MPKCRRFPMVLMTAILSPVLCIGTILGGPEWVLGSSFITKHPNMGKSRSTEINFRFYAGQAAAKNICRRNAARPNVRCAHGTIDFSDTLPLSGKRSGTKVLKIQHLSAGVFRWSEKSIVPWAHRTFGRAALRRHMFLAAAWPAQNRKLISVLLKGLC